MSALSARANIAHGRPRVARGANARATRASRRVVRAGRFETERTYIMIKCVWSHIARGGDDGDAEREDE